MLVLFEWIVDLPSDSVQVYSFAPRFVSKRFRSPKWTHNLGAVDSTSTSTVSPLTENVNSDIGAMKKNDRRRRVFQHSV